MSERHARFRALNELSMFMGDCAQDDSGKRTKSAVKSSLSEARWGAVECLLDNNNASSVLHLASADNIFRLYPGLKH